MADKKVVKFTHVNGWRPHPTGAVQASLGGVSNHYRLGDAGDVITSAVVRVEYDESHNPLEIETLNTIYRLES